MKKILSKIRDVVLNIMGKVKSKMTIWVGIFIFGGYFFGNISFVNENLTYFILGIILTSFIPAIIHLFKKKSTF